MTTSTQTPPKPSLDRQPLLPPEEKFWQRYSANHEAPLSGIGSLTIYIVLAVLIIAGIKFKLFDTEHAPLPMGAVEFDPDAIPGGGGGDPEGSKGGTGDAKPDNVGDITKADKSQVAALPKLDLPRPPLKASELPEIIQPEKSDDGVLTDYTEAFERVAGIEQKLANQLMQNVRDQGKGGTGQGGGLGKGTGTGTGDDRGPGKNLDARQQRVLRWNMVFDTRSGEDYRQQLQSLGAILALPTGENTYAVYKDLRPGAKPSGDDLKTIKRVFWVDNRPDSVRNLALALKLPDVPAFIVAFFPPELEEKLAKQEQDFVRARGRVGQITETRFRISLNGRTGKYEPQLVDMR